MAIPLNTLIVMVVAAIFLGTLLPTIASYMSDDSISKTLSLTAANIPADIYVNDTANTTELQMRWDISGMDGKAMGGLNITTATLRLCNDSAVDTSHLNITRIVNQTWTESETITSYKALTIGISQNLSFTTTTGCINVDIFGIINPDRTNSYTSFKIDSNISVTRANVYWVFNTTELYINDTLASHVVFNSKDAAANTPTLTLAYEYSIPGGTQAVFLLVPLFVVIFVAVAFIKFKE